MDSYTIHLDRYLETWQQFEVYYRRLTWPQARCDELLIVRRFSPNFIHRFTPYSECAETESVSVEALFMVIIDCRFLTNKHGKGEVSYHTFSSHLKLSFIVVISCLCIRAFSCGNSSLHSFGLLQ